MKINKSPKNQYPSTNTGIGKNIIKKIYNAS